MLERAGDEGGAGADLHGAEIAAEEIACVAVGPARRRGAAFGPFGIFREAAGVGAAQERRTAEAEGPERGDRPFGRDAEFGIFGTEDHAGRSEEHTSELQSLMRISYAVFCLKK